MSDDLACPDGSPSHAVSPGRSLLVMVPIKLMVLKPLMHQCKPGLILPEDRGWRSEIPEDERPESASRIGIMV